MMDKPKIEVGQRWVTRESEVVRILSVDAAQPKPIIGQGEPSGRVYAWMDDGSIRDPKIPEYEDLISLAPSTVKREVALYRSDVSGALRAMDTGFPLGTEGALGQAWTLIAQGVSVEFTLLPGESADA